jgi:hypothetical protein
MKIYGRALATQGFESLGSIATWLRPVSTVAAAKSGSRGKNV